MSNNKENGYLVGSLHHAVRGGAWGLENMPRLIREAIENKIWTGWTDRATGQIFSQPDFYTFITTPVLEGLGATPDQIKALCIKDLALTDLIDQELTRKPGGANNPYGCKGKDDGINNDNVMIDSQSDTKASQGNSVEYTLRRLRKHHPELHEQVLANEMSPNAAAIEAGFRKHTITVTVDVEAIARKLRRTLDQDQIDELIQLLQGD